jgi:hypothetical protein
LPADTERPRLGLKQFQSIQIVFWKAAKLLFFWFLGDEA